jgi:hypothetical protein
MITTGSIALSASYGLIADTCNSPKSSLWIDKRVNVLSLHG